jgi:hypothetical protein
MKNSPFPAFCSPSLVFLSYVEHTTNAPLMILLPFQTFSNAPCCYSAAPALCQHSGPYPLPQWTGTYGIGLFWCKADQTPL